MKRVAIVLGMILLLGSVAVAQEPATGLTGKGVKLGLNMSEFSGDDATGLDSKTGIGAGAFLTFSLSPTFAIQPEFLYMAKGAKIEESEMGSTFAIKFKVNYIEIPVLLKYSIPTQGSTKPYLFAGPVLGLLAGAKVGLEADTPLGGGSVDIDFADAAKSTDFGVVFGGGLGFKSGENLITIDFRYTMGMSKIVDFQGWNDFIIDLDADGLYDPADLLLEDPDIQNSNMSFLVGISF